MPATRRPSMRPTSSRRSATAVTDASAEPPVDLLSRHRSLPQDLPAPVLVDSRDVDDRRRSTDQLAGVDGQVRFGEDRGIDPLKASRRPSPAAVGAGLEDRGHGSGERSLDQADTEPLGIFAAGERIAVLRVRDNQGHRAGKQGADSGSRPGPEAADELPHSHRREVHDGRGLALVASLDPVYAIDRRAVERVAGEAVERVRRKDRDAPLSNTALEGAPRGVGPVALDRDDLAHSITRTAATIRSMPARSLFTTGR